MKRAARLFLAPATVVLTALTLFAGSSSPAEDSAPTLSFFSGGSGARATWLPHAGVPSRDGTADAIGLLTTPHGLDYLHGYAGILVHHVRGIAVASFADPWFWNDTPPTQPRGPLPAPRLVVEFQNGAGVFVGYAALRQNTRKSGWVRVDDRANYPRVAWELSGGPCGFLFDVRWKTVQKCFAGDTVLSVFLVADPDGTRHVVDDLTIAGRTFSRAAENAAGWNDTAGPGSTTDRRMLPAVFPPA
jgi:hypothetical protein